MKNFPILIITIIMSLALTGCTFSLNPSTTKNTGGVFKTYDFGEKWQTANSVKTEKKKVNLDNTNVHKIVLAPSDRKNVYLTTRENGLWYSDNAGGDWRQIFPQGNIYALTLDPKNNGVVYVSLGQKVFKTLDLGSNWNPIYLETRPKVIITTLASDPINNLLVYLGTSLGELYKTEDGGESWQLVTNIKNNIREILIQPKNNKIIYLATASEGIYKSSDQGKTWQNLKDNFYQLDSEGKKAIYQGAETFRGLIFDLTKNDGLI